jgi:hypothetical protein
METTPPKFTEASCKVGSTLLSRKYCQHLGAAAAELVGQVGAPQQGAGAALPRLRQQPLEQRLQLRARS